MKLLLAVLLLLPCIAGAQNAPVVAPSAPSGALTLGGIPQLLADKLKETKPMGVCDLAGHAGGGAYLPLWTFHDMSGKSYVEAMNFGYRAIEGSKPGGVFIPAAFDLTSISSRVWNFQWARDHVTRSVFPDVFVGPAALLPLDGPELKQLKIKDPLPWLGFVGSVRF